MSESRKQVASAIVAFGLMSGAASAAVWDFQSETVGNAPTNGVLFFDLQSGNQVKVVDGTSTPADPFGGAGNKSLWMEDSTGSSNSTVTFNTGAPGYTQGTLSVKFYVADDAVNTYQYVDINGGTGNANTGAGDIGPWIQYIPDQYGFRAITSSGPYHYFTNTVPHNSVVELVIQFDTATDKFSGTVNGVPLVEDVTGATSFNFFNNMSELSSVRIVNGTSEAAQPSSTTFYDNVTLVPEPSAMGLIGLGVVALARRARRA